MRRFWDLETIGITPIQQKPLTAGDSQILQEFRDSYRIEDGRRVIRLPKKTRVFYLPHHAVKERRGKIKWRIVFDASSSEGKSPSNDVLGMGPNLLPEELATVLHFRGNPVAIIGDIQQALLQLSLDRTDRDLTRFLWYMISEDDKGNRYTTNEVVTYRFTRLPFGLTCSPFLLS